MQVASLCCLLAFPALKAFHRAFWAAAIFRRAAALNLLEHPVEVATARRPLVRPTGAGKSTLLRILAGLETRLQGSIKLGGEAIKNPSRRIQVVFQDNCLLPWLDLDVEGTLRSQSRMKIV
jgi:ABC-type taurine transport system ATPase subunit